MAEKTKAERVTALLACDCNPVKDRAVLEAASEAGFDALEAHSKVNASLRAASKDATAANDIIKNLAASHKAAHVHADGLSAAEKAAADKEAAKGAEVKAAEQKPKTEAEWLAEAPEHLRTLVEESKAATAAHKSALVASLKAAQKVYSSDELEAMDVAQLTKVAQLAKVTEPVSIDFSGRGGPRIAEEAPDYLSQAPPDGYRIALDKESTQKDKVN